MTNKIYFNVILPGILITILMGLTACTSTSTKKGTVGIERQQLLLVSEAEMVNGGRLAYASV
jgi:hypothetical protein